MSDWLILSKASYRALLDAESASQKPGIPWRLLETPPLKPQSLRSVENSCNLQTAEHPGQFYSVGGMSVL